MTDSIADRPVGEQVWPCTLRRVHSPHRWWSRRKKRYYRCPGRR